MYYYELMLKEGANLGNVVGDLNHLLSMLSECEAHFKKVPYEFRNLSSASAVGAPSVSADFIEKIESEIEENRQQEEYEKEELVA
jgi:hypothetical protein